MFSPSFQGPCDVVVCALLAVFCCQHSLVLKCMQLFHGKADLEDMSFKLQVMTQTACPAYGVTPSLQFSQVFSNPGYVPFCDAIYQPASIDPSLSLPEATQSPAIQVRCRSYAPFRHTCVALCLHASALPVHLDVHSFMVDDL